MKTILTAIYNAFYSLNPAVKVFLGIGSMLLAFLNFINELWADLFGRLDSLTHGAFGVANFAPLGLVNYIFPLDTVLTFIVSYATLRGVCASIRIVKSFVPTVS